MLTLFAAAHSLHMTTPAGAARFATGQGRFIPLAVSMTVTDLEQQDAADALTMFAVVDLDGNGAVSKEEFRDYLAQYSYTESASTKIFTALDANGDGEISLDEFKELAILANEAPAPELVEQVDAEANVMFDTIDVNGDGEISAVELQCHLRSLGYTQIASDAVLRTLDSNSDGVLSREELQKGFLKYSALRQAVVALVKQLVMSKRWSSPRFDETN